MEDIQVYVLHPMLVIPFPCIHKICEMHGNPSMSTSTSHHIPHIPVVVVILCRPCQPWGYILGGLMPRWRASLNMDCSPGLLDFSHASMRHVKIVATNPWPLVPHITSHTLPRMAWLFSNPAKSWPIALVVRWSVAWMKDFHAYILHPRLFRFFPYIHKICEMYGNLSMVT